MKNGRSVNEKTIVGRITKNLRNKIDAANYAPGTHLKESEISHEFGVSRVPVREAFRLLQSEGYLEVIPNRGSFVKPISQSYIQETAFVYKLLAPIMLEKAIPNYRESTYKRAYSVLNKIENLKDYTNIGNLLWDFANIIFGPSKYDFMLCILEEIYRHSNRLLAEMLKNMENRKYKVETHYRFLELCKEGRQEEAINLWSKLLGNMEELALGYATEK